jgi:EmrB/QacA subfamily drug resistance transporter
MQALDSTILNTALPGIAASLGVPPLDVQDTIIAYLLAVAVLTPASAWLAQRFGIKPVFMAAIGMFCLGSLFCALSPSLFWLTFSRVVQGAGGAFLLPLGRLAVIYAFPHQRMAKLLSFISIPGMAGPLLGPLLGGLIVEYWSWPWIFLLNLPIGIVGLIFTWRDMPDLKMGAPAAFDWPGFMIFGLSIIMITMSMEGLTGLNIEKQWLTALLGGGIVLAAFFWIYARKRQNPLFQPGLFRVHSFAIGIYGNLAARLSISALPFLNPLMLQLALGYSPSASGLMLTIPVVTSFLVRPFIDYFISRLGFRRLLALLTMCGGLFMGSMGFVTPDTPYIILIIQLSLLGLVNGLQFVTMNTITLIGLNENQSAQGNSLLSVVMQISSSLAVGTAALLLTIFSLPAAGDTAPGYGFQATYLYIGLISALSGFIFLRLKEQDGAPRPERPEKDVTFN